MATTTHGRVLVRQARTEAARGILVGFHGYMENAVIQMQRLEEIPESSAWTLVAIQGLHQFYRGRSEEVVASWMTRQDREVAIADNVAYVGAALEAIGHDGRSPTVYIGFSQGAAMAFRAAIRGRHSASGIISVGGDVPPELLQDASLKFPPVLLARGARDDWYTPAKLDSDIAALTSRGVPVQPLVYDGAHDWSPPVVNAIHQFLSRTLPPSQS